MFADISNGCLRLPERLCAQTLAGQDFSQAPVLPAQLLVDAQALRDCDSAGIAALLWLLRHGAAAGGSDCLAGFFAAVATTAAFI